MPDLQGGFTLSINATNAGYRVDAYESVGSTNAVAMQAARDNQADRLWVVAQEQTKGRGRRGRSWQSDAGNLAASLLLILPAKTQHTALLGFVAGISLIRTIAGFQNPQIPPATLKWPNDVLWEGAKLSGILLEAETLPNGDLALVVGMGINVQSAPQGMHYPTTSLSQMGIDLAAEEFFTGLSDNWVDCFEMWTSAKGRAEILAEWRKNAAGIGLPIRVERHGDEVKGIFETIDELGRLIVNTPSGARVPITAGDVFFQTTSPSR